MKISVCGKGGSGKSTIAALLANEARAKSYRVLVVDSDESNSGLFRMFGFNQHPVPLMEFLGGKKGLKEKMSQPSLLAESSIPIETIPKSHLLKRNGLMLISIGKILQSLEGCACPMGVLSREFLKRLSLQGNEVAVVDMEAGIEHFGRGVEASIDSVLIVTEPSFDSLELAEKINSLAAEVGVERVWTILNKIGSKEIASRLGEELEERGISVIGSIGYEPEIFQSGLEGRPVRRDRMKTDIGRILDQLL